MSTTYAHDLFAGAGGWDLAAAQLGIRAEGIENMKEARATREAAGLTTIHDDVWTFRPRTTGGEWLTAGLIASPPCQTFSAAGKGSGRRALDVVKQLVPHVQDYSLKQLKRIGTRVMGDERTALVLTPLWFAMHHPYQWLAWEQVPTVLPVWEACAEVLREQGWYVWTGLLHAEQYGVPQTRKRAFLLASKLGPVAPPEPTHSRYYSRDPQKLDLGVEKWVSMAEALTWGLSERPAPTITGGGTETGGAEPIAKWERYTQRPDFIRMTKMPNSAQRNFDEPAPTIAFGHDAASCRWFFGEDSGPLPAWCHDRPSTTIVGSFKPEIVAAPGYRTTVSRQNAPNSVRISIHEAGILQSFPADYPWQGAKGKQFLQCGNAVPPGLAMHALMAASGAEAAIEEVA